MYYGSEQHEPVTVAQYIHDALSDDEIVLKNDLYRTIYDRYYAFVANLAEGEVTERQKRVVRFFTTSADAALNQAVYNLILEEHPLTVKTYEESIPPEEQTLALAVPKSVLLYKKRITELACNATAKAVNEAQKSGDEAALRQLVRKLQMLNTVKNRLSKELNRL